MLPYSLALLNFWGMWPLSDSKGKNQLYYIYSALMILFVYANTLSQVIDLFISYKNLKIFINNAFILLSTIGAGVKAGYLLWKREKIIRLMKMTQKYPCRPQTVEEESIQKEFDSKIKYMNLCYISLFLCTITALTIASFFRDVPRKQLYYRAWIPFDYSSETAFWLAYMHQVIAHGFDASLHAAYDTLAPSMMIQACAQFAILNERFRKLPHQEREIESHETRKLGECVKHHLQIFEFAKENNEIFGGGIFLQYSVSSLVLCMSVLRLSQLNHFSPDLASIVLYLISMVSQVFMPCFAGNQISIEILDSRDFDINRKINSSGVSDAIYSIDWTSLTATTQKSLVLIMRRSQKPVTFISGYIIPLSIDSFNRVMKLSYSIFNVLHDSSAV